MASVMWVIDSCVSVILNGKQIFFKSTKKIIWISLIKVGAISGQRIVSICSRSKTACKI